MAINGTDFLKALEEIELSKGISKERVLESLKEAMAKGYRKQLGGDDADVEVTIDPESGMIEMTHSKNIVDEVQDDFLEIELKEAKNLEKQGVGIINADKSKFVMPVCIDELRKATAMSIKSVLRQKFAEAEKDLLYEAFKDKIDTMITGRVESIDGRGCAVTIGKASVYLPHSQMIGDETYKAGDPIRVYVSKVENGSKGTQILVSRSNEGFLKALFFEEIREVYDGTIEIKNIAREAGERSKVAVYCSNPDIDPAGACIGPNGTRIQKIVTQLGNGSANKEKIDIVTYSNNVGLFVMESLKPARVAGIVLNEQAKTATVVVKDDSLSLAIGRRGVNARLAVKLTGFNIDIKTESEALEEGIEYQSFAELQAIEAENKATLLQQARMAEYEKLTKADNTLGTSVGYVAPQERVYEDEINDFDETLEEKLDQEELTGTKEVVSEELTTPEIKEETPVKAKKVEEKVEVVETKAVKTTTTISALENALESESKKSKSVGTKKTYKKNNDKKDEDKEDIVPASEKITGPKMEISYSEEELAEIEKEEAANDDYDEDIDYEDYDEYYDEDDK